ncbi:hypothetical protein D7Z54_25835 [Salibacterium salarium]|uniref:Uncharacterized protein n=1 Tax=Salibacterium salarium TaxID=284579 RepID=A0A3R9QHE5_9BACI|nr:hypothetical protein D7Z54_25835 [Salibacterium salarium]
MRETVGVLRNERSGNRDGGMGGTRTFVPLFQLKRALSGTERTFVPLFNVRKVISPGFKSNNVPNVREQLSSNERGRNKVSPVRKIQNIGRYASQHTFHFQ